MVLGVELNLEVWCIILETVKGVLHFVLHFVGKQLKQKISAKDREMPQQTGWNEYRYISWLSQSAEPSIPLVLQWKNDMIAEIALTSGLALLNICCCF